MRSLILRLSPCLAIAACASTGEEPIGAVEPVQESSSKTPSQKEQAQEFIRKVVGYSCDADPVQGFVGKEATGESGAAILKESGAKVLRWGPPNSAWTMDYRVDRVNVRYDSEMVITDVTCG